MKSAFSCCRGKKNISRLVLFFQKSVDEFEIGIIASAETIQETVTAITNLIRGSKQGNVYAFLERMNAERKKLSEDLGLKENKKRQE